MQWVCTGRVTVVCWCDYMLPWNLLHPLFMHGKQGIKGFLWYFQVFLLVVFAENVCSKVKAVVNPCSQMNSWRDSDVLCSTKLVCRSSDSSYRVVHGKFSHDAKFRIFHMHVLHAEIKFERSKSLAWTSTSLLTVKIRIRAVSVTPNFWTAYSYPETLDQLYDRNKS